MAAFLVLYFVIPKLDEFLCYYDVGMLSSLFLVTHSGPCSEAGISCQFYCENFDIFISLNSLTTLQIS